MEGGETLNQGQKTGFSSRPGCITRCDLGQVTFTRSQFPCLQHEKAELVHTVSFEAEFGGAPRDREGELLRTPVPVQILCFTCSAEKTPNTYRAPATCQPCAEGSAR